MYGIYLGISRSTWHCTHHVSLKVQCLTPSVSHIRLQFYNFVVPMWHSYYNDVQCVLGSLMSEMTTHDLQFLSSIHIIFFRERRNHSELNRCLSEALMIKIETFYKVFMYFQCCFTDQRNKRVPRLPHPFLAWKRNITGEKCIIKRFII